MSGYTPVFSSIYTGSLHGQWPGAAVMACLLPICDKNGIIDLHPKAISAMTGWPLALLLEGIEQLTTADPESRNSASDGRRLVPLDARRSWGWQVVNFVSYREKARLMAKSSREVASGQNAQRIKTASHRRRPPLTAVDRLSNANANLNANPQAEISIGLSPVSDFSEIRAAYPHRKGSQRWADAESSFRARLKEGHSAQEILAGVRRYAAFIVAEEKGGTAFVQQAATFLGTNRGFLDPWGPALVETENAPPSLPDGRDNPIVIVKGRAVRQFIVGPRGQIGKNPEAVTWE